ncbi:MAG: carbohydrate ABC transporter permease [Candidatus Bathyarchaeia archaeon]
MRGQLLKITTHVLLISISLIMLLPTFWTIISSLKPTQDIFGDLSPLSYRVFIPQRVTFEHYKEAFSRYPLLRFFINSVIVAAIVTFTGLIINSLAGYSLARFRYPGRRWIYGLVLVTMMMPFEVIVIPLYLVVKEIRLINTFYALILPIVTHEISIFLFYQFFQEIPQSIEESAYIDGASYFNIWLKIILPMSKPVFVTATLLHFTTTWNAFFWPLVAVNKQDLLVYQIGVVYFKTDFWISWGALFAATTVGMLPVLLLFIALQKFYVRGVALTGLKE